MYWFIRDCLTMTRRSMRHTLRNIDSLITGIMLPVMIMIIFVVIFGGAIDTGTSYVNYIVPGVILTCAAYGSSSTAMIVARDMTGGLFNRFRSLPMSQISMVVGHVNGSVMRNTISSILVLGAAYLLGFRPTATFEEWGLVAGLLLLVIIAISWMSAIFGLVVKSIDAAMGASFGVMFLPYISSAFVPLATLPAWIHGFVENQPMTPIIDTLRGLLIGTPIDTWQLAVIWPLGVLIVSYTIVTVILRFRSKG